MISCNLNLITGKKLCQKFSGALANGCAGSSIDLLNRALDKMEMY